MKIETLRQREITEAYNKGYVDGAKENQRLRELLDRVLTQVGKTLTPDLAEEIEQALEQSDE